MDFSYRELARSHFQSQVPLTAGNIAYYTLHHAQSIKKFMGEDVLALVMKQPEWKSNLRAMREKHRRTFAN